MNKILTITILGGPLGCLISIFLLTTLTATLITMHVPHIQQVGNQHSQVAARDNSQHSQSVSQAATQESQASSQESQTNNQEGHFSSAVSIAGGAISLAAHLNGPLLQSYNTGDPFMASVLAFWHRTCANRDGSLCSYAQSGNLQCVEFVTGAFSLAHITLPYAPDAHYFWDDYKNVTDWREIPVGTGLPQMGDIIVWHSWQYDALTKSRVELPGHVAIIVNVTTPHGTIPGQIYFAQANAPSSVTVSTAFNVTAGSPLATELGQVILNARLGAMTIYPNLAVNDSSNLINVPTSTGWVVDGYIRYTA
jgi:hypothetical protein